MSKSNRKFVQILAGIVPNLCQLSAGFLMSLSSYAIPQMLKNDGGIQYTQEETSWFASIIALGSITGSLQGAYSADKFGRKLSIMIDCVGLVLSYLMTGYFTDLTLLLISRFMAGHFVASNLVASPIFISETSHPDVRGFTGSLMMIEFCIGFTLSMLLGALLHWRKVVMLAAVFPVLCFILMMVLKESPTWLIRQGKESEAVECLHFYRGNEELEKEEMEKIKENVKKIEKMKSSSGDSNWERFKTKLKRLTDSTFLKPFLLLNVMLNIGLEWGGFPALAFYMHTILEEVKIPVDPYWMAVILAAFRSIICMGQSLIIVKAPRRKMYLSAGCIVATALFCQAAYAWIHPYLDEHIMEYARWIPLLAVFLQYLGFGLGWGAIIFMLQGELLPSDMRSFGSGLLGIIDNIFLFLAVKSVPLLIASLGVGGMFSLYCGCVLLIITICFFNMPETKGMSLEDIEDYYSAMRNKSKETQEKV